MTPVLQGCEWFVPYTLHTEELMAGPFSSNGEAWRWINRFYGQHPRHMEALGWAFTHQPTQEAYRRSTGEEAGPIIDRYRAWVEENIVGPPPFMSGGAGSASRPLDVEQ